MGSLGPNGFILATPGVKWVHFVNFSPQLLLRLHDGKQATKGKPVPNVSGEISNPAVSV